MGGKVGFGGRFFGGEELAADLPGRVFLGVQVGVEQAVLQVAKGRRAERFVFRRSKVHGSRECSGLVVELGPGTGPVTEALLARGVAPERLLLVEYSATFCALLRARFPQVRVIQGDAYRLADTLADAVDGPVSAIVSSLPLLNKRDGERHALLDQAFELMGPDGLFVQFTYGMTSPIPLEKSGKRPAFFGEADKPVWLNLPPARVWRYRRADHYARTVEPRRLTPRFDFPPLLEAFQQKQFAPALARLRKRIDADLRKDLRR